MKHTKQELLVAVCFLTCSCSVGFHCMNSWFSCHTPRPVGFDICEWLSFRVRQAATHLRGKKITLKTINVQLRDQLCYRRREIESLTELAWCIKWQCLCQSNGTENIKGVNCSTIYSSELNLFAKWYIRWEISISGTCRK